MILIAFLFLGAAIGWPPPSLAQVTGQQTIPCTLTLQGADFAGQKGEIRVLMNGAFDAIPIRFNQSYAITPQGAVVAVSNWQTRKVGTLQVTLADIRMDHRIWRDCIVHGYNPAFHSPTSTSCDALAQEINYFEINRDFHGGSF